MAVSNFTYATDYVADTRKRTQAQKDRQKCCYCCSCSCCPCCLLLCNKWSLGKLFGFGILLAFILAIYMFRDYLTI